MISTPILLEWAATAVRAKQVAPLNLSPVRLQLIKHALRLFGRTRRKTGGRGTHHHGALKVIGRFFGGALGAALCVRRTCAEERVAQPR